VIEQILSPRNLQRALRQVIANKGSAGVDGMKTTQLTLFFQKHRTLIMQEIRDHKYLPQPIMGVEIPKGKGKTRLLGIPTVMDRLLQQAVSQAIMLHFDSEFSVNSYGFRSGKNAHQAVCKALEYIHDGYTYIVDIDLKNFFDEVDHCLGYINLSLSEKNFDRKQARRDRRNEDSLCYPNDDQRSMA